MNKIFSFHSLSLSRWAHRGVLVAALLTIVLGVGAFSTAPSAHAASLQPSAHTTLVRPSSATRLVKAVATDGTIEGCPSGAACIYPQGAGWNNGNPEGRGFFYSYGFHPLSNEIKMHIVFNNQTGGALVWLCKDATFNNCPWLFLDGASLNVDLGPINYIVLTDANGNF